jgi:hypothetical protein
MRTSTWTLSLKAALSAKGQVSVGDKEGEEDNMATEFKVVCDAFCMTTRGKARKIETHLTTLTAEGWDFVALDPCTVFGTDVGFYLVMKRDRGNDRT